MQQVDNLGSLRRCRHEYGAAARRVPEKLRMRNIEIAPVGQMHPKGLERPCTVECLELLDGHKASLRFDSSGIKGQPISFSLIPRVRFHARRRMLGFGQGVFLGHAERFGDAHVAHLGGNGRQVRQKDQQGHRG